jgi:copper transporter 1
MNMLFNWSTENLCVVFESWRINTPFALIISCIVIIGLSASYEMLRAHSRKYEERLLEGARKRQTSDTSSSHAVGGVAEDQTPLLAGRPYTLR